METPQIKEQFLMSIHRFGKLHLDCFFSGDLTRGEFFCLAILRRYQHEHPDSPGMLVWELAQKAHVRTPAISRMLGTLEQRGLVLRSVCPQDRRNVSVAVTAQGEALWHKTADGLDALTNRVIGRMGPENMAQLTGLLDRLCNIMEEEKEAFGQC